MGLCRFFEHPSPDMGLDAMWLVDAVDAPLMVGPEFLSSPTVFLRLYTHIDENVFDRVIK